MSKPNSNDFVANFDSSVAAAYAALLKATKAANRLPSDISFYRTLDEQVDRKVEHTSQVTLDMANTLWKNTYSEEPRSLAVETVDDIASKGSEGNWVIGPGFRAIVDSIDTLLEKIDVGIDEVLKNPAHHIRSAASKPPVVVGEQSAPMVTAVADADGRRTNLALVHAKNTPRPQLLFKDVIDNSHGTPWVWKIREKPHAKVPLDSRAMAVDGEYPEELPHPYEHEIKTLEQPQRHFEVAEPQEPCAWDTTPFEFVETPEQLKKMMDHLCTASEIAIDLEHHNYRSYQGFTCLIQISSRTHDYVVDAIALRSELACLNQVTADPRKIKVFHGAESDMQWLQRDFGVYVVGLFDTYHASKVLNMAHHSLAHLLRVYCAYEADKKYQLADWRIRPLPLEMITYARADTHFLLYVYDRLRNELLLRGAELVGQDVGNPGAESFGQLAGMDVVASATQPMELTLQRSAQTSLRKYTKDTYDADTGLGSVGWATLLRKWKNPFGPAQAAVYRKLHEWRDSCAREEDESTRYVLPNHMLFVVSEKMPDDVPTLLALCRPTPPLVRLHASDMVRLISQTRKDAEARLGDIRALVDEELRMHKPKPVHTRFDDMEEPAKEEETMDVDQAKVPQVADDVLSATLLGSVDDLLVPTSALFGSSLQSSIHHSGGTESEPSSPDATEASKRAREIRSNLVLTMAVPRSLYTSSAPANNEFTVVGGRQPASQSELLQRNEAGAEAPSANRGPIVISETYGRQKSDRKEPTADDTHAAKRQRVGDLDLSKIALGDIDDDSDQNTNESTALSAKGKKRQKKSSKRVDLSDVKAFDYTAGGQNTDAIGKTRAGDGGGKKDMRQKKRGPGKGDNKFNPYGNVGESQEFGNRPKKHKIKSGNRTMSYKK
ncbi:exosome nuclease subunit [Coemansia sp. RSA 1813]|nr:exosome nuclease subunit [Coemansia sp. RSA 1646]KAJ1771824.1 exosome nuclease subunit [Coemansia sp. RSA 1843]KAJ2216036.1 exosome nuclease subunit [Coemansia sp. RSA 487]KAJ2570451.1 exosome nuclease subunit [Coemansia sp. RSA 1813]